jgi:hypothetical protein
MMIIRYPLMEATPGELFQAAAVSCFDLSGENETG